MLNEQEVPCVKFPRTGNNTHAQTQPEVPDTPDTPALPDQTPESPVTKDTPKSPETPKTPESPETPLSPETPRSPVTPVSPRTPATPSTPGTPDTPLFPYVCCIGQKLLVVPYIQAFPQEVGRTPSAGDIPDVLPVQNSYDIPEPPEAPKAPEPPEPPDASATKRTLLYGLLKNDSIVDQAPVKVSNLIASHFKCAEKSAFALFSLLLMSRVSSWIFGLFSFPLE